MDKILKIQIEEVFEKLIGNEVIILCDKDILDNLDIAIYDKLYHVNTDISELNEYLPDYAIFEENGKWFYSYAIHNTGSWEEPPHSELVDSDASYDSAYDAFVGLYEKIMLDNFIDLVNEIDMIENIENNN